MFLRYFRIVSVLLKSGFQKKRSLYQWAKASAECQKYDSQVNDCLANWRGSAPRLPLTRELAPKATEGEKI
jgi:hypothetical protein